MPPVRNRRNTQWPRTAITLGDLHPAHRRRKVAARRQSIPQFVEIVGQSLLKLSNRLIIDARRSPIGPYPLVPTLARLNKVLRHRDLTEEYESLRKCGVLYERAARATIAVRGRLHRVLMELFCDFSSTKSFLYSTSGRALIDKYRCNPYRIVRAGRTRFERAMRRRAPRIRQRSLGRLWEDATSSARHQRTREYIDLLELELSQLWEEFLLHEQRKTTLEKRLISLPRRLRQKDPSLPTPTRGVITAKNLARLIGETGPISDFTCAASYERQAA